MRIIAGEFRGRVIKSPPDQKTRPTSDRLRETLFNILAPQIDSDTRFLDLCAGTGAVGIEAISRGAGFSTFVDKSRRSCGLIEENLDLLKIPKKRSEVICDSAKHFLSRLNPNVWDIIFYDPPYKDDYSDVLETIGKSAEEIFRSVGTLVVEHHFKKELAPDFGTIRRSRVVKQGDACLSFYQNS
jgi:16S rRNA (guanine(966)-N(2))-methyltransferase RsmD